jgi:hypothetical protein
LGIGPESPGQQGENRGETSECAIPIHLLAWKAMGGGPRPQEKFVIIFIALFLDCDKK